MPQRIDQIVARVEDPANPVVWLDPSTSEEIWAGLPGALKERGFAVVLLSGVVDTAALESELVGVLGGTGSVRDALLSLSWEDAPQGWAVLFREPGRLREGEEAAFEELLETFAQVHEMYWAGRRAHLKLVVTG